MDTGITLLPRWGFCAAACSLLANPASQILFVMGPLQVRSFYFLASCTVDAPQPT